MPENYRCFEEDLSELTHCAKWLDLLPWTFMDLFLSESCYTYFYYKASRLILLAFGLLWIYACFPVGTYVFVVYKNMVNLVCPGFPDIPGTQMNLLMRKSIVLLTTRPLLMVKSISLTRQTVIGFLCKDCTVLRATFDKFVQHIIDL